MNVNKLRSATILGLGVYLTSISPAVAQVRLFDLPADDAVKSIPQFGQQSGLQIIAPADKLGNVRTPAVSGQMDARMALNLLIKDTGLIVAHDSSNVITLKVSPQRREQALKIDFRSGPSDQDVVQTLPQQQPTPPPVGDEAQTDRVIIVGSQIAGAEMTGAVPVTVLGAEELGALGLSSGEDLFRSLPIAGDVSFNTQTLSGGNQGAARGDVSSINLRGIGSGYTLLLLNGRRTVPYPLTQGRQESSYNANAIPTFGLERLEILRDGAAALYGSDAVAGVVNNVLQSNFDGFKVQAQYGIAEDTNLRQLSANLLWGTDFDDGRGNFTTFLNYGSDTSLLATDQDFTASADRRSLVEGTPFAGNVAFDTRAPGSGWGGFQVLGGGIVRSNGVALTNASGQFHIQPTTNAGCALGIGNGLCIDDGVATTNAERNLRYDPQAAIPGMTVTPAIERLNVFSTLNYEIADGLTAYGEAGLYASETESMTLPVGPLAATPITMAADSYYNPFGPITSPNRLPGLNIGPEGVPITVASYLLTDVGGRLAQVTGKQHRLLAGLKGDTWGWDWDTALLYSDASAEDLAQNPRSSLWQAALSRTTSDAYNPFNGGDLAAPSFADGTPSADLTSYMIEARRYGRSSLGLWDFKVSRPDLFALPAGDVGVALGVEVRWETSEDDRERTGDFSTPYVDPVTGISYVGDTMGASAAWDVKGNRTVHSAFAELAIPLVSPDLNIPLVYAADLQIAGRYESYSDVGSVAKPKVAGSWDVFDGLRLRSSWQQGFVAPGLQQLAPVNRPVSGVRLDDVMCEADIRAGRIASWAACTQRPQVQTVTAGNPDLKPEESESLSYGFVLESTFLPPEFGDLTLTVDRWRIQQEGKIAAPTADNAITLDYLLRTRGSSNPNVIRLPVTQADSDFYAGTGLAPAGVLFQVNTNYANLDLREIEGFDVGVIYNTPPTPIGDFTFNVNYSELLEFFQSPSADQQALLAAQAAGEINSAIAIGGAADLLEDAGNPKSKWNAGLTWRLDNFSAGLTGQYTGRVFQKAVVDANGNFWEVEDQLSIGLWGDYTFEDDGGSETGLRVGVRNLTDEDPPLATTGYLGNLYQPYGRYWYARVTKAF